MSDPFALLKRPPRVRGGVRPASGSLPENDAGHSQRAHSKFSASASERWFACPGSVELSEGLPDKSSPWAEEGTRAHEVLEAMMCITLSEAKKTPQDPGWFEIIRNAPEEMIAHGKRAANFIFDLADKHDSPDIHVETRIYLDFIHQEMFGTFDGGVVELFGTLHVFDYKYGAGVFVSPVENLQMIFYGIGLAAKYQWNFKRVRLWIIQPRVKGYDGPLFWDLTTEELFSYVDKFREAVDRVLNNPFFAEGSHCHWCRAKSICPIKIKAKEEAAKLIFGGLD